MGLVFVYAQNQFVGLTFEPFVYQVHGLRYRYGGEMNWALRLLCAVGLTGVARTLFARLAEVS